MLNIEEELIIKRWNLRIVYNDKALMYNGFDWEIREIVDGKDEDVVCRIEGDFEKAYEFLIYSEENK
jgi:hypothetical protein